MQKNILSPNTFKKGPQLKPFQKISAILIFLFFSRSVFSAAEIVHYKIDIDNPEHHRGQITIFLPKIKSDHVDLVMPAWRTGKYKILPLANGVRNFKAKASNGGSLQYSKIDRNTWRILLSKPGKVLVSYELYANELGSRTRHIDNTHAFLDATATLMYSPEFINLPVDIELNVPRGWKTFTGMEKNKQGNAYVARDYHQLADSPIETGINRAYSFKDGDIKFEVVIWGKGNFEDLKVAKDLSIMVKAHKEFWGSYPFKRYVFMIHATDGARGATEHINSTIIQRPRWKFTPHKGYLDFLSTASHEFVHTWNVKFYRPVGLVPYHYDRENYSKLLWFAEGGTSYLADKLLVKAGLMSQKEYFKRLAKTVDKYLHRPGTSVMSASSSSFNEWISSRNGRAVNDSVNIYSKGHMLSLWLDMLIMENSKGKSSIQDLHRALYQQFPHRIKGYADKDVINLLKNFGVGDAKLLWNQYVDQTQELPIKEILSKLGLKYSYKREHEDLPENIAYLGLSLEKNKTTIQQVLRNSPAWKASLNAGDILVALNDYRVTSANFSKIVASLETHKKISISYFHNDKLYQTSVKTGAQPLGKPTISLIKSMDKKHQELFKLWLGVGPDLKSVSKK